MSHEIALAAADRAAELAAIRVRAARELYEYGESGGVSSGYGQYAFINRAGLRVIDVSEPSDWERAALRELVQAQHDRRTLLARLDEAEAALTAHYLDAERALDQLTVVEIDNAQARVNDTLIPSIARMLSILMIKPDQPEDMDGEIALYNYIEWTISDNYVLTLQRIDGKSPSDLKREATAAAAAAIAEYSRFAAELQAARAIVSATRYYVRVLPPDVRAALDAYDAVRPAADIVSNGEEIRSATDHR